MVLVNVRAVKNALKLHENVMQNYRARLITLHSNFEIFQKGHPAVEFMIDRRIFER